MRPIFHPSLVNERFGDPGLYVECLFEKRALLFDLGDIRSLPARKILRVSDVFVSHCHMDHFFGFDWLLRLMVGREKTVRLFGPLGFIAHVRGKLAGYTWNLVHNYEEDLVLEVTEVVSPATAHLVRLSCRSAFAPVHEERVDLAGLVLLEEPGFRVRAALLDHRIPCLAFALEEKQHINVWKDRLAARGLPVGPWLNRLMQRALAGAPDEETIEVAWRDAQGGHRSVVTVGEMRREVLRIVPGQKLAYVTDVGYHEENAARIAELARGADLLFIESPFLDEQAENARRKCHLTARQAGLLGRLGQVRQLVPFHFSPAYRDRPEALEREALAAFESG